MWTKQQINNHKKAAKLLIKIKNMAFSHISQNKKITEYEVQQLILDKFKEFNLKTDRDPPIVAFGKNTCKVHHFPNKKSKSLQNKNLIMIDLWARLNYMNAPFADITWMAYKGKKIPKEIQKPWKVVINIRDRTIQHIRNSLKKGTIPSGRDLNQITRNIMNKEGFKQKYNFYTGHSLGFTSAHGKQARLSQSNRKPLLKNIGYTIEPGIYIRNKFGLRSEIDFYISSNKKLVLTTPLQRGIVVF